MFTTLQRYSPQLLSLMRIAMGITFVEHGTQKLLGFPAPPPGMLPLPLLYFTGTLETVGGILIALGLFTRPMAVPYLILMTLSAYDHAKYDGYFWNRSGIEYPLMWAVGVLYFLVHGGGPLSLDHLLLGRAF